MISEEDKKRIISEALKVKTTNLLLDEALRTLIVNKQKIPQYLQVILPHEIGKIETKQDVSDMLKIVQKRVTKEGNLVSIISGGLHSCSRLRKETREAPYYRTIEDYCIHIGGNNYKAKIEDD